MDKPHRSLPKTAVIGGGSFGTVLARLLGEKGCEVRWWMRDKEAISAIQSTRHNPNYLSRYRIPSDVQLTSSLEHCVDGAKVIIIALPCKAADSLFEALLPHLQSGQMILNTMKGIRNGEYIGYSSYLESLLDINGVHGVSVGALGGPNLAAEIAQSRHTGSIIGSRNPELIDIISHLLHTRTYHLYGTDDLVGVELGAALKNIYAIAAGLLDAIDEGQNCKGLFVSDSFQEAWRFSAHFGTRIETISGMSGLGDLVATSLSILSRNHRLGMTIGAGLAYEQASRLIGGVAEGYDAMLLVRNRAKELGIHMPIAEALYHVVKKGRNAVEFVDIWFSDKRHG